MGQRRTALSAGWSFITGFLDSFILMKLGIFGRARHGSGTDAGMIVDTFSPEEHADTQ